jgi:hypothetical protein
LQACVINNIELIEEKKREMFGVDGKGKWEEPSRAVPRAGRAGQPPPALCIDIVTY